MRNFGGHLAGQAVLALLIVLIFIGIAALVMPRHRRRIGKIVARTVGGLIGLYIVLRGIAEFFIVDYNAPASYRDSWGGPSLAGVFAVHSGPGFLVLVAMTAYLLRWRRARRRATSAGGDTRPP